MNENVRVSDSVLSEDADIIDWELHKSKTFTNACFLYFPSFNAMWDVFIHTRPEVFLLNLASMHSNKSLKPQKGVKSSKRATFKKMSFFYNKLQTNNSTQCLSKSFCFLPYV